MPNKMTAPDQTLERTLKAFAGEHAALQPAPALCWKLWVYAQGNCQNVGGSVLFRQAWRQWSSMQLMMPDGEYDVRDQSRG